ERLFTFVYHEEDLKRHPKMVGLFQKKLPSNHVLARDEFAAWSLSYWPGGGSDETVDFLFQRLLQDCPVGMAMPLEQWLFYFEGLISTTEFKLEGAPAYGVHFV